MRIRDDILSSKLQAALDSQRKHTETQWYIYEYENVPDVLAPCVLKSANDSVLYLGLCESSFLVTARVGLP